MATEPNQGPEQIIYANWVRTNATPFEVGLDLGYTTEDGPMETYPVRVVMSWEHAKGMVELLSAVLDEYEANAGPIREFEEETADED